MNRFLKNTVITILGFFALVLLLEGLYRLLKVPKITHHSINAKAQQLVPQINGNTVLILGDSKLEWGIKPLVMQQKLPAGLNVIDMAMPGSNGNDLMQYLIENNIYPKLIILGYASNYGTYNNHGFDKLAYSNKNRITENALYWLDQHFYFRDRSVLEYIQHGRPYFKSHVYDALGGATVTEYGDYAKRFNTQIEMYKGYKNTFKQSLFDAYSKETDSLVSLLKQKGTIVCGIQMPVTPVIHDLQNAGVTAVYDKINYTRFYNFVDYTYKYEPAATDSSFFYDGCHLQPAYAEKFTRAISDSIITAIKIR